MNNTEILRLALKVMHHFVSFGELTASDIKLEASQHAGAQPSESDLNRVVAVVDREIQILKQMYSDELLDL